MVISMQTFGNQILVSPKTWVYFLSFIDEGRKTVHFTFDDGTEMVEEYATDTDLLLSKSTLPRTPRMAL